MPFSEMKTLWKGVTPSVNLKTIDLSYSNLKTMPDFSNLTLLDKLVLFGCKNLLKVHPSIGQLTNLSHLDLGQCLQLKELTETIGQLTRLGHLDLGGCVNLKRLPEQLCEMKCLKMLDASYTLIDQLPDSIGHLKELVDLKLINCKNLRKLPEQIGNMESLKWFDASFSAIEQLPDTFAALVNLEKLHLRWCEDVTNLPNSLWKLKLLQVLDLRWSSKLEQLPEQLGKMKCLEELYASGTTIEELPDSIGLLSRLRVLDLEGCKKVKNLTSLAKLYLHQEDMFRLNLPDMEKDMKLEILKLRCNVCLWLPVILSFSSLKTLYLSCESQSFSPNELFSLSKLSNLRELTFHNWKSSECSFPELPDLSSLKQLKKLYIRRGISLQSLSPFPPHLEELGVHGCTSLQDLPDLSILKELGRLRLSKCSNLKSISLKQSFLQVGQNDLYSFEADIPNREVADWFSYKSTGNTLSFTIPPNSGNNFFGIGLWIVYKCKFSDGRAICLKAVITNKTKNSNEPCWLYLPCDVGVDEVQSRVEYLHPCTGSVKLCFTM